MPLKSQSYITSLIQMCQQITSLKWTKFHHVNLVLFKERKMSHNVIFFFLRFLYKCCDEAACLLCLTSLCLVLNSHKLNWCNFSSININDHNLLISARTGHWPLTRRVGDIHSDQWCHGNDSHPALASITRQFRPRAGAYGIIGVLLVPRGARACVARGAPNWIYLFWCVL